MICLTLGLISCEVMTKRNYDCSGKEKLVGSFVEKCRKEKEDSLTRCIQGGKEIYCKIPVEIKEK